MNKRDKKLFEQAGFPKFDIKNEAEKFADLIRADEREACAKVVEAIEARCIAKDVDDPPLEYVAAAIRERGNA